MTPPAEIEFERHPDYQDEEEPPALFPHLIHEEHHLCVSCHPSIFSPKTKYITHDDFDEGKYCGKCHGEFAFPYDDDEFCEKCHVGGGEQ